MGLFGWFAEKAQSLARGVSGLMSGQPAEGAPGSDAAAQRRSTVGESSGKRQRIAFFVHSRTGSMFRDGDGDLAHEFYEEDKQGGMRRVQGSTLCPEGARPLPHPALNPELNMVLCLAADLAVGGNPLYARETRGEKEAEGGKREEGAPAGKGGGAASAVDDSG